MKHVICYLDTANNGERAWCIELHDRYDVESFKLLTGKLSEVHNEAKKLAAEHDCRCFIELA